MMKGIPEQSQNLQFKRHYHKIIAALDRIFIFGKIYGTMID